MESGEKVVHYKRWKSQKGDGNLVTLLSYQKDFLNNGYKARFLIGDELYAGEYWLCDTGGAIETLLFRVPYIFTRTANSSESVSKPTRDSTVDAITCNRAAYENRCYELNDYSHLIRLQIKDERRLEAMASISKMGLPYSEGARLKFVFLMKTYGGDDLHRTITYPKALLEEWNAWKQDNPVLYNQLKDKLNDMDL